MSWDCSKIVLCESDPRFIRPPGLCNSSTANRCILRPGIVRSRRVRCVTLRCRVAPCVLETALFVTFCVSPLKWFFYLRNSKYWLPVLLYGLEMCPFKKLILNHSTLSSTVYWRNYSKLTYLLTYLLTIYCQTTSVIFKLWFISVTAVNRAA